MQPYGLLDEQAHAGSVTDNETLEHDAAIGRGSDWGGRSWRYGASRTLLPGLDDALDALAAYGTAAETPPAVAARLRATALTLALFRAQGLNSTIAEWASARTTLDLQDLYSAQRPDGGWPRDFADGQSDVATTAETLQALWALSHGGTATDPTVTARGLDWLALHAESALPVTGAAPPGAAGRRHAGGAVTLALHGRAGRPAVDRLLASEPYLSARGRAYLAMTLGLTGRAAVARLLLDRVGSDAEASGDAVALRALLVADPASMRGPVVAVARGLLAARVGAGWGAPAATAEAIAALQQYALSVAETPPSGSYRLIVNGRLVRELTTGPASPEGGRLFVTVPGAELHRGDNSVRFETAGGRLYYSLRAVAVRATSERPLATQRSESGDLGLLRVYEPGPDSTTVALTLTTTSALTTLRLTIPCRAASRSSRGRGGVRAESMNRARARP